MYINVNAKIILNCTPFQLFNLSGLFLNAVLLHFVKLILFLNCITLQYFYIENT